MDVWPWPNIRLKALTAGGLSGGAVTVKLCDQALHFVAVAHSDPESVRARAGLIAGLGELRRQDIGFPGPRLVLRRSRRMFAARSAVPEIVLDDGVVERIARRTDSTPQSSDCESQRAWFCRITVGPLSAGPVTVKLDDQCAPLLPSLTRTLHRPVPAPDWIRGLAELGKPRHSSPGWGWDTPLTTKCLAARSAVPEAVLDNGVVERIARSEQTSTPQSSDCESQRIGSVAGSRSGCPRAPSL